MNKSKFYYLFVLAIPFLFFLCSHSTRGSVNKLDNNACKCNYEDTDRDFKKMIQKDFYFCLSEVIIQKQQLFKVTMGNANMDKGMFLIQNSDKFEYFKLEEGMDIKNVEVQTFIDFSSEVGTTWNLRRFGLFYDYTCTLTEIEGDVYTISLKDNYDVDLSVSYNFKELKIDRNLDIKEIIFDTNGYGHEVRCQFKE